MKTVINNCTDPYFNLACEEYLMENSDSDIFMLWQNKPSVIIGISQNAFSEVNLSYAQEHGIPVCRRMTGGGAVYHDLGNINFTFITKDDGCGIDFRRFLMPITEALSDLGCVCEINGRNDIVFNGRKISGNAQCHKYGKILHHGTLLIDTDFGVLEKVLNVDKEKMKSKGITSVRSRVENLISYLKTDVNGVKNSIIQRIATEMFELDKSEVDAVNAIKESKYTSWDFIFGRSKTLENTVKKRFDGGGTVEISYTAERGIVKEARIFGDFFSDNDPSEIEKALIGSKMIRENIEASLNNGGCSMYGITNREIAEMLI